jgi:hypothetical protein
MPVRNIAKITKTGERNATVSAARLRIETFLKECTEPVNRREISEALGIDPNRVGGVINNLLHEGRVVRCEKTEGRLLNYRWRPKITDRGAENMTPVRGLHVNSLMPTAAPGELMPWMSAPSVRPGADDHKQHKSRGF